MLGYAWTCNPPMVRLWEVVVVHVDMGLSDVTQQNRQIITTGKKTYFTGRNSITRLESFLKSAALHVAMRAMLMILLLLLSLC